MCMELPKSHVPGDEERIKAWPRLEQWEVHGCRFLSSARWELFTLRRWPAHDTENSPKITQNPAPTTGQTAGSLLQGSMYRCRERRSEGFPEAACYSGESRHYSSRAAKQMSHCTCWAKGLIRRVDQTRWPPGARRSHRSKADRFFV